MKKLPKKYPLLVSVIISCIIVVASIFVLAFCGINLSPSLGGGSQFEVAIPDNVETKTYVQNIKKVLKEKNITYDSFAVEDKFLAESTAGEFSQRFIVVKIDSTNISEEKELEIRTAVSTKLGIALEKVSEIDNIVSSIKTSEILLFGLGIGIIAIALFIFGLFRYNVYAGLSFMLSILHNLILFLSLIILTRLPLSLVSLAGILVLTLVMVACLVSIYEKNKIESEMSLADKETPSSRLIRVEAKAVKPYIFVVVAVIIFACILFFIPVRSVLLSSLSLIIALLITCYSTLLIAPAIFGTFMDISKSRFEATLSRNDTINREIKKKIAKAKVESEKKSLKKDEKIEEKKTSKKENKKSINNDKTSDK